MESCDQTLKTYSGEPLKVCGQVMVDVQYGDVLDRLPLVVARGDGPCLFGRDWLARIKLDWSSVCVMTASSKVEAVLAEYPDVFSGELGCFRGEPVTVEVDPDVRPRFFKPRIVPLAYRQQVDQELDRQVEQGLWKPVTHSKWAAPSWWCLNPVGKRSGCVGITDCTEKTSSRKSVSRDQFLV